MSTRNLDKLMAPQSVVAIGASERPGSVGAAVTRNLLGAGFSGEIHLVNRKGGEIAGRPVWRSLGELLSPPDLAVIMTPAPTVPGLLKELAAKGLPSGRAEIIVNRWHKSDISVREVEDLLKTKVAAVFQNDYRTVHKSTLAGSAVKPDCDLGKAFLNFAKKLDGPQTPDKGPSQGSLSLLNALRSSRA